MISPFCQTISTQLHKLAQLNIFHGVPAESLARIASTCHLLPCPQLPYMVPPRHRDWFHGLGEMQEAMNAIDFDVAIVGAGAWSIPLAVHAKKLGRIGIHLGVPSTYFLASGEAVLKIVAFITTTGFARFPASVLPTIS